MFFGRKTFCVFFCLFCRIRSCCITFRRSLLAFCMFQAVRFPGPVLSGPHAVESAQKRIFVCSVFTHEITTLFIAVLVQELVDALGRAQKLA